MRNHLEGMAHQRAARDPLHQRSLLRGRRVIDATLKHTAPVPARGEGQGRRAPALEQGIERRCCITTAIALATTEQQEKDVSRPPVRGDLDAVCPCRVVYELRVRRPQPGQAALDHVVAVQVLDQRHNA